MEIYVGNDLGMLRDGNTEIFVHETINLLSFLALFSNNDP